MMNFLRRRWFLLTCFFALLACSKVHFCVVYATRLPDPKIFMFGSSRGEIIIAHSPYAPAVGWSYNKLRIEGIRVGQFKWSGPTWQTATLGHGPHFSPSMGRKKYIGVPLWTLLTGVMAWIVLRELRWREKMRANAESSAGNGAH
jgi:hypothetical protein